MDEAELRGWQQMVHDGLYPGPTATLRLIGEVCRLRGSIEDARLHYRIGEETHRDGLPVAWDYVALSMAGALLEAGAATVLD